MIPLKINELRINFHDAVANSSTWNSVLQRNSARLRNAKRAFLNVQRASL